MHEVSNLPSMRADSRLHSPDADHRRTNEVPLENSRSERKGITKKNKGGRNMNCPDCGEKITEVTVERFQTQTFKVDHDKKEITPLHMDNQWETNEYAYHCRNCDSLNVDQLLSKYKLKEE